MVVNYTKEELTKLMDEVDLIYQLEGEKIIITGSGGKKPGRFHGWYIESIPDNIEFIGNSYVQLSNLKVLPPNTKFNNKGDVDLSSIIEIPDNFVFNNEERLKLSSVKKIGKNVVFNCRSVSLDSLEELTEGTVFNNQVVIYLPKLIAEPKNCTFNNCLEVYMASFKNIVNELSENNTTSNFTTEENTGNWGNPNLIEWYKKNHETFLRSKISHFNGEVGCYIEINGNKIPRNIFPEEYGKIWNIYREILNKIEYVVKNKINE